MKKKYRIVEGGLLWNLGLIGAVAGLGLVMFAVPWCLAMITDGIADFFVGLL